MAGVDSLTSMFPGRDRSSLQAALDSNGGSVERTVEFLLSGGSDGTIDGHPPIVYDSGNPIADRERARQLEQDEIMARALAMEEERAANEMSPMAAARGIAGNVADNAPALPTMDQVSAAMSPVITGIQQAGKVAVDTLSGLYQEFVNGATESTAERQRQVLAERRRAAELDRNETEVLRGDLASPRREGLQARPRRAATGIADGAGAQKKSE